MRQGFTVFDTHVHLGAARHSGRRYTADELLRDMDRVGVDRALAIPFPVVEDHRREHDIIGRAVAAHRERLSGAACLDPFLPETQFRDEVRRCREVHGFVALKLQPQYHGLNPVSSRSDFFFETALENGMAVVCHTGAGAPFALPSLFMMPARRFPSLRIVLGHCGGGIFVHEAIVAASFCSNITLEISSLMPHHVMEVLAHVPAGRLMAGSDLPESLETEIGKVLALEISEAEKREILAGTACRVFGEPL